MLLQAAKTITLSPPPADFILPETLQFAQSLIVRVADRLTLAGLCQVDFYMHADKGEVIVMDVTTVPDLSAGSVLLRQVSLLHIAFPASCT